MKRLNINPQYSLLHQQPISRTVNEEGTVETIFKGGIKEQVMLTGIKKRVYPDGLIMITMKNQDIKVVKF